MCKSRIFEYMKNLILLAGVLLLFSCSKTRDYKCTHQEYENGVLTYEKVFYTQFDSKAEKNEYERQINSTQGGGVLKLDCEKL